MKSFLLTVSIVLRSLTFFETFLMFTGLLLGVFNLFTSQWAFGLMTLGWVMSQFNYFHMRCQAAFFKRVADESVAAINELQSRYNVWKAMTSGGQDGTNETNVTRH